MMASTSTSYDVLSDEQKRILTEFYNKGMTTTAKNMREVILKAAERRQLQSWKKLLWTARVDCVSSRKLTEKYCFPPTPP